jgi:hypothetical protein
VVAASPTKICGEAVAPGARAAQMELRGRMEATKRLWVVEAMGRERGNGDGAKDF